MSGQSALVRRYAGIFNDVVLSIHVALSCALPFWFYQKNGFQLYWDNGLIIVLSILGGAFTVLLLQSALRLGAVLYLSQTEALNADASVEVRFWILWLFALIAPSFCWISILAGFWNATLLNLMGVGLGCLQLTIALCFWKINCYNLHKITSKPIVASALIAAANIVIMHSIRLCVTTSSSIIQREGECSSADAIAAVLLYSGAALLCIHETIINRPTIVIKTKAEFKRFLIPCIVGTIILLLSGAYVLLFWLVADRIDVHGLILLSAISQAVIMTLVILLDTLWLILHSTSIELSMKVKNSFSRYISHEIRSPLSSLLLGLEYISDIVVKSPNNIGDLRGTVEDCVSACHSSIDVVSDMLFLDKVQQNMMMLHKEWQPFTRVFRSVLRQCKMSAAAKQIELSIVNSVDDLQSVSIHVDLPKIQQVLRNYLTNSIKFTPSGKAIFVEWKAQDEFSESMFSKKPFMVEGCLGVIRIEVRDLGAGIDEVNLRSLFTEYTQINENALQNGKGSGLGLWICKTIVELHGGIVGATSEGTGKGSCFWFELPWFARAAVPIAKSISVDPSSQKRSFLNSDNNSMRSDLGQSMSLKANSVTPALPVRKLVPTIALSTQQHGTSIHNASMEQLLENDDGTPPPLPVLANILVVDDSALARKMLRRALDGLSSHVDEASNGLEALNAVKRSMADNSSYDIVIMDYHMPVMSGVEAISAIRAYGFTGIIFALTGTTEQVEWDRFMQAGCNKVLLKPLSSEYIRDAIRLASATQNVSILSHSGSVENV